MRELATLRSLREALMWYSIQAIHPLASRGADQGPNAEPADLWPERISQRCDLLLHELMKTQNTTFTAITEPYYTLTIVQT